LQRSATASQRPKRKLGKVLKDWNGLFHHQPLTTRSPSLPSLN